MASYRKPSVPNTELPLLKFPQTSGLPLPATKDCQLHINKSPPHLHSTLIDGFSILFTLYNFLSFLIPIISTEMKMMVDVFLDAYERTFYFLMC